MQWLLILGLLGFVWLFLFQIALSLGAPLGHMAWGGARRVLLPTQSIASLISAGLAAFGVCVMAHAAGILSFLPIGFLRMALWGLCGLFALSLIGNLATSSKIERAHGVPLTLILMLSSGVAALNM